MGRKRISPVKEHPVFKDRYDFSNSSFATCTMKDGKVFKFDKDDYDKIKSYKWRYTWGRVSSYGDTVRKETDLSHVILIYPLSLSENKGKVIIFKNHDTLDYRKSNLVLCTPAQRAWYTQTPKNNTSGVAGVSFAKRENKWRAYITLNRKQIGLGYYDNFDDAVIARLKAEKKYYREFSPQKKLYKKYGLIPIPFHRQILGETHTNIVKERKIINTLKEAKYFEDFPLGRTEFKILDDIEYNEGVTSLANYYGQYSSY